MESGQVDTQSWVQSFPLTQGAEIFRRMVAGQGTDIKAVLCPEHGVP